MALRLIILLNAFLLSLSCFNVHGQSFNASNLGGESLLDPTSLCFGPDQRLYVLDQNAGIKAFTITRTAANDYDITATESISLIGSIQNHNDNGAEYNGDAKRLGTGILVVGTPDNPVIYVTSSDYRIGGLLACGGCDINLDTNSGIISRLSKNGSSWLKVDLVRGLPRSEENHATNGLFLDENTNTLYVAQGGNTNNGGPSFGFAYLCEFALSSAVLTVDLDYLETLEVKVDTGNGSSYLYDLPTVDDPTRNNANGVNDPMGMEYNGIDLHDPFGGNDGLNQARIVEDGPVQIYAPGFRNIYDILITEAGHMYTWDNGANAGWGTLPSNEGYGTATNNYPGESGTNYNIDGLHKISGTEYYGGHPVPTRANPSNAGLYTYGTSGTFRTAYVPGNPAISLPYDWPPLPLSMANPIEGDYWIPGSEDSSIYSVNSKSLNGLCEYTASNFNNVMKGELLCTGHNEGKLYRVKLDEFGDVLSPDSVVILASGSNLNGALDVTATGDGGPFAGTIWIATWGNDNIVILEPSDFTVCTGTDNSLLDEDADEFSNADEIDNGTSPCNGADMPNDHDGTLIGDFKVSDLNDPDDDDDGLEDDTDLFVWDPNNGLNTTIPIEYPLLSNNPGEGFYGLGFTGLMANGDDYLTLWKTEDNSTTEIVAGGAAGLLTYVGIDQGDALNAFDNQHNAFQFGIDVDSTDEPFIAEAIIHGPVFPDTIQNFQSMGLFLGTGDQDNYVKIVINANGGTPGIAVVLENNGSSMTTQYSINGIGTELVIKLALMVNPINGYVRAQYAIGSNPLQDLGNGFYIQGPFLAALKGPDAIAMGVISTARGSTNRFEATWAHLSVKNDPVSRGEWYTLQDGSDCQPGNQPGACCQGRHEASYVQSGDKFYLLGGRENFSNVNVYNPATDTWTIGANAPNNSLHHFQAVDYHGLILAAGAFTGNFPNETPVAVVRVYDPITNTWHVGPSIPVSRRRGSSGTIIKNDTLYLVGGTTSGHLGGNVNWLDRYALRTDSWSTLSNAPNQRDHFHAVVHEDKIYAAAGRRTSAGNFFLDTEATVDIYDISGATWDTVAAPIPTKRAGNTAGVLNNELLVIGGERESGAAKKSTEALNLTTETWRTLDSLNLGRHGTQAIVNNDGLYVASGATAQGGSNITRTTEAFYFYGQTDPILAPTIASNLAGENQNFNEVPIEEIETTNVYIYNEDGNQAMLLKGIAMFDSMEFTIDTVLTFPRFLKPGDSLRIPIQFAPTAMQYYVDTLYVQHTGATGPTKKIVLTGEGTFNWLGDVRAYVDSSATGNELGNSWPNAFKTLTQALNVSQQFPQIEEVWIAEGTYTPAEVRAASFVLRDSLTLYGGFDGTEILLSQRDVEDFPVILSGDIGITDDSTDNVYHVVVMTGTADSSVLDGLTIEYGLANGASAFDKEAAGVLNFGKLVLRDATIRNCTSINPGSALVNSGITATLTLENILFLNNSDPHLVNKGGASLKWKGVANLIQLEE